MLQLLCLFDYCQNETVTFRLRYVFHWWFHLCYKYWDTWNGFVCLETSTSEGFWELLQSFSFTYATINEDIYATLCVDIIRRRNHVHMLYVQCCYTWYFKNLFLLGLGFLHGSKNLKKMIEGTTRSELGTNLGKSGFICYQDTSIRIF